MGEAVSPEQLLALLRALPQQDLQAALGNAGNIGAGGGAGPASASAAELNELRSQVAVLTSALAVYADQDSAATTLLSDPPRLSNSTVLQNRWFKLKPLLKWVLQAQGAALRLPDQDSAEAQLLVKALGHLRNYMLVDKASITAGCEMSTQQVEVADRYYHTEAAFVENPNKDHTSGARRYEDVHQPTQEAAERKVQSQLRQHYNSNNSGNTSKRGRFGHPNHNANSYNSTPGRSGSQQDSGPGPAPPARLDRKGR
jgi:hypothetical protein